MARAAPFHAYAGTLLSMREVVLWVVAMLITWCLLVGIAIAVLSWRLDRRNRVSPNHPSSAPMMWLWSPARPALLHRRLRRTVQMSRLAVALPSANDPELSVPRLREQLEQQSVVLDHHVVLSSRLARPHRRVALRQLDHQVTELEHVARRLTSLDQRPPGVRSSGWHQSPDDALARLSDDLHLLEEAQAEVDEVDRVGYTKPDAYTGAPAIASAGQNVGNHPQPFERVGGTPGIDAGEGPFEAIGNRVDPTTGP